MCAFNKYKTAKEINAIQEGSLVKGLNCPLSCTGIHFSLFHKCF